MSTEIFDAKKISRELKIHARAVGIPSGAADEFIKEVVKSAEKSLGQKKIITKRDLKRALIRELKKYNKDFAYVYENYDKII